MREKLRDVGGTARLVLEETAKYNLSGALSKVEVVIVCTPPGRLGPVFFYAIDFGEDTTVAVDTDDGLAIITWIFMFRSSWVI